MTTDTINALYASIDTFVNFTIIATLVAFFWKGTWDLIDIYFMPENYELSLWMSFFAGSVILILFTMLQVPLNRKLISDERPVLFLVTSRLHAYVIGITQVLLWRGAWGIFDLYFTKEWMNSCIFGCLSILVLSIRENLSIISGQPLCLVHDFDKDDYFTVIPTTREIKDRRDWVWLFWYGTWVIVVDNLLIVVAWRLPWNLSDIYLLPSEPTLSAYMSLFICVTIAFPVMLGERTIRNFCRKPQTNKSMEFSQVFVAKFYIFLASCITTCHWRGVWNLQTELLLPRNHSLSALISHSTGFIGLMFGLVTRTSVGGATFEDSDLYGYDDTIYSMTWVKRITEKMNNKVAIVSHEVELDNFAGTKL